MRLAVVALLVAASPAEAKPKDAYFVSYGGYATTEVAVIRGRVGRGTPVLDKPDRGGFRKTVATARVFLGRDVEDPKLEVVAGGRTAQVVGDDEGFFEARVPGPFPAGTQRFEVRLVEKQYAAAPLVLDLTVVDGKAGYVIVTDIDDTIIETGVTGSKAAMIKRIAGQDARDIRAYPGAAEALSAFHAAGVPIVYLSASPIELGPRLMQFLALRGFPLGMLYLRYYPDAGIGDPTPYKRARFQAVLADFPGRNLILFGDNGEKDPEIFLAVGKETGRVGVSYIRRTLAVKPGDKRYDGTQLFGAWAEVVPHARGAGILK
jgi:phosphatidate phosphatase APP1